MGKTTDLLQVTDNLYHIIVTRSIERNETKMYLKRYNLQFNINYIKLLQSRLLGENL